MRELFSEEKLKNIERIAEELIIALGDNPQREGMVKTPHRFAKACSEWFEGMQYTNEEIAEMYNTTFNEECDDLIIEKGIKIFSHCEHHIALMYDMTVNVGYLPKNNKVIGLSKIDRICEMVAKRFQIQERLCRDIADVLSIILGTEDIIVYVSGKHSCKTSRGVKQDNDNGKFTSSHVRGAFKDNPTLRAEFYRICSMN